MTDQWQDPRKAQARPPGRAGRRPLPGRPRPGRRQRPGATSKEEEDEAEQEQVVQEKSNSTMYIIIGSVAAVLLVVIIAAFAGGGGKRPVQRRDSNYVRRNPANIEMGADQAKKKVGYQPPAGVSSGDCGSIRGICKTCQWETDLSKCANGKCGAQNFFFFHKEEQLFKCFRCGAKSPPVKCEKCNGPLYKPKTKAR